jgi:membrane protein
VTGSEQDPTRLVARLKASIDRRLGVERSLVSLVVRRVVDVRPIDTALALASRLFIAVIPLSLLATAVTPIDDSFAGVLERTLGLTGAGRDAARALFATPETVRAGVSLFGLLVLLYTLTNYARGLQQVFLTVWRLPPEGAAGVRRRLVWIGGLALYLVVTLTLDGLRDTGDDLEGLYRLGIGAGAVVFYTWTPYVLLGRRVRRTALAPTIALTLVASVVFSLLSSLYVPDVASSQAERYGVVGFAFALLTWLFVQSMLIVGSAIVGAAVAEWWSGSTPTGPARAEPETGNDALTAC